MASPLHLRDMNDYMQKKNYADKSTATAAISQANDWIDTCLTESALGWKKGYV